MRSVEELPAPPRRGHLLLGPLVGLGGTWENLTSLYTHCLPHLGTEKCLNHTLGVKEGEGMEQLFSSLSLWFTLFISPSTK